MNRGLKREKNLCFTNVVVQTLYKNDDLKLLIKAKAAEPAQEGQGPLLAKALNQVFVGIDRGLVPSSDPVRQVVFGRTGRFGGTAMHDSGVRIINL
jgi:hypothetical protein